MLDSKTETTKLQKILEKIEKNTSDALVPIKFLLPGASLYGGKLNHVYIKPLLGKDEKMLASSVIMKSILDENGKVVLDDLGNPKEEVDLDSVIGTIMTIMSGNMYDEEGKNINAGDLFIQDFLACYTMLQYISYSPNNFVSLIQCPNEKCELKTYQHSFSMSDISVDESTKKEDDFLLELPVSKSIVKIVPLRASNFVNVMEAKTNYFIESFFMEEFDGESLLPSEANEALKILPLPDKELIISKMKELLDYGIKEETKAICPQCKTEKTIVLFEHSQVGGFNKLPFRFVI